VKLWEWHTVGSVTAVVGLAGSQPQQTRQSAGTSAFTKPAPSVIGGREDRGLRKSFGKSSCVLLHLVWWFWTKCSELCLLWCITAATVFLLLSVLLKRTKPCISYGKSVSPAVTLRYCVKTRKRRGMQSSLSGSPKSNFFGAKSGWWEWPCPGKIWVQRGRPPVKTAALYTFCLITLER